MPKLKPLWPFINPKSISPFLPKTSPPKLSLSSFFFLEYFLSLHPHYFLMEGFTGHKRSREDTDSSSPEAKRIHADLLLNMLSEDDSDTGDCNPADQDLATVIKSLEEEIALPPAMIASEIEPTKAGIEYLQEASDDELGIPPPEAASSASDVEEDEAAEGFGRIWVFEDEVIPAWYEGLVEFGFLTADDCGYVVNGGGGDSAVLFDGGIGDGMGCY